MGYYNWANKQLEQLLAKDPTYTRSKFPGMQLGMANQTINSRIPGADKFARNIMSSGQSSFNNASKYATDASQLLGVNAGIQGQTDQSLGDLQLQEADWKKFGLQNLNQAYGANAAEDQNVYADQLRKYETEAQIRGAQAANKLAKRQALWNTVGGIVNLGLGAFTGGATSAASGISKMFSGNKNPSGSSNYKPVYK